MEAHDVEVPAFSIDKCNVTNRDFLRFIQAGGYKNRALWDDASWEWKNSENIQHPAFWRRDGNLWMYRGMFGEVRLPQDWPVYLSHAEATAYATWLGRKLPTEAQFHRAAYGSPRTTGTERFYPWGNEAPSEQHGNFDFHDLGAVAGGRASGRGQRFRRAGSSGQRVGMDAHGICAFPGLQGHVFLSRIFGEFF